MKNNLHMHIADSTSRLPAPCAAPRHVEPTSLTQSAFQATATHIRLSFRIFARVSESEAVLRTVQLSQSLPSNYSSRPYENHYAQTLSKLQSTPMDAARAETFSKKFASRQERCSFTGSFINDAEILVSLFPRLFPPNANLLFPSKHLCR